MDHQIDFENPNQVAIEANADSMKERYEVLKRKLTIMKGAVTNQSKVNRQNDKTQRTKLMAKIDRKRELEYLIKMQENHIIEKQ